MLREIFICQACMKLIFDESKIKVPRKMQEDETPCACERPVKGLKMSLFVEEVEK